MLTTMETFTDWLRHELDERNWRQSDLSRASGISTAHVSDILSGERNIGKEGAIKIAKALKVPRERVFQAAGLLEDDKTYSREVEKIIEEAESMSPEDQRELLSYIRWMNNKKKK